MSIKACLEKKTPHQLQIYQFCIIRGCAVCVPRGTCVWRLSLTWMPTWTHALNTQHRLGAHMDTHMNTRHHLGARRDTRVNTRHHVGARADTHVNTRHHVGARRDTQMNIQLSCGCPHGHACQRSQGIPVRTLGALQGCRSYISLKKLLFWLELSYPNKIFWNPNPRTYESDLICKY